MGSKSTFFKFFVVVILIVLLIFQILAMKQSDRLYERINKLQKDMGNMSFPSGSGAGSNNDDSKAGDWLVRRIGSEPPTLNPITYKDLYASLICGSDGGNNIFETLLTYNFDTAELEALLAESWDISDDGLEFTFTIRDDAYFSDGTPVTSDDLIFAYETIINPEIDAANLANYFKDVEGYERIDDKTVVFRMSRAYFKSLEMLGGIPVIPKHVYQFEDASEFNQNRTDPVGSGPYLFDKWDVGSQIVLTRNENYWGKKPNFKKIVYRVISNDKAALQSLQSHTLDVLSVTPEQFVKYSQDEEFRKNFHVISYWNPSSGFTYIGWNAESAFFDDVLVRQAMTHLIDRNAINEHIFKNLYRVTTGPFFFMGHQNNPEIEPWPFDPQRACELLAQAGWVDTDGDGIRDKNGVDFNFKLTTVSGNETGEKMCLLIKDQLEQVGVIMELDMYEWSVFTDKLHKREFEAVTLGWSGDLESDPYQVWHSSQTEGGSNYVGFNVPRADELIVQARATIDADKRNKLFHEFHAILHEQQPYTFMFNRKSLVFIDKRIENVTIHKLGLDSKEWYVPKEKQQYH
jgi:peptide/nickel transport system substrate-binding protein